MKLFVWDDGESTITLIDRLTNTPFNDFGLELDSEIGPLANDFSGGQTFRTDTIAYLKHCLSLGDIDSSGEPTNSIIRSFKIIGDAICKEYTEGMSLQVVKSTFDLTERKIQLRDSSFWNR